MHRFALAVAVATGLASCADAQDETTYTSGPMPIVSAGMTIETCLQDHTGLQERLANCPGIFTERCIANREGGETTIGMVQCSDEEHGAWDARLNTVYGELRARFAGQTAADTLQQAQRDWIAFRDAECRFQASIYEGGSIAQVISVGCHSDMTARRALELIQMQADGVY